MTYSLERIKKMHSSIYADDFYLKAGAKQNYMQNSFFLPKSLVSKSPAMKNRVDKWLNWFGN